MRRRVPVGWLVGVLLSFTALSTPTLVGAQADEERLGEVERAITDLRSRIDTARSERTAYGEAIVATESRMAEVKVRLFEAERDLIGAEAAVLAGEDAVATLGRRIRLLDAELAGTRIDQRLTRDTIRERAVELYMTASAGIDIFLLGSQDLEATSIRLEYNRDLLESTEVLLQSLEVLERLEVTRQDNFREEQENETILLQQLEVELASAAAYAAEVAIAREDLQQELSVQESLLAEVVAVIADHEGHVDALEAESREIELEILRRQVREGRAPGKLAWPVGGGVTSPFGWRIHPILGGRRLHTGIDLGSATGEPIHAAANGLVILAERWGGYGRAVVIDHGGGLSTVYAHQSSIAVSVGDDVLAGDVIGYIGCSGYCTGPHLHFEVREVGAPVDPMLYLPG